jgi:hypothetical protein
MSAAPIPYHPGYAGHGLNEVDEIIIADWRAGVRVLMTAKRLGLAHTTVVMRRRAIRLRYEAQQTSPLPSPEERAKRVIDMEKVLARRLFGSTSHPQSGRGCHV